jgi:hypothetical protein
MAKVPKTPELAPDQVMPEDSSSAYTQGAGPAKKPKPIHVTDDYETKDHLNTLSKAHEIMSNPEKMGKVKKLVNFHKKTMRSLDDIKQYHQDNYGAPGGGPKESTDTQDEEV